MSARWGGEEFIISIDNINEDLIIDVIDKFRITIMNKVFCNDKQPIKITSSFGISKIKSFDITGYDVAFKLADKALYKAKNNGRNRVEI